MLKIAVIGSGATAFAVVDAFRTNPKIHTTLIHPKRELPHLGSAVQVNASNQHISRNAVYRRTWQDHGLKFPPPKTQFGTSPDTLPVEGWGKIWKSNLSGGLTQFWGASTPIYSDTELKSWPVSQADLRPHYEALSNTIGITGQNDGLRRYLDDDFATLPPIQPVFPIAQLLDNLQSEPRIEGAEIYAGYSRLAVETRTEAPNACDYSGACMSGCVRGAIFSAKNAFESLIRHNSNLDQVRGYVHALDLRQKTITLNTSDEKTVLPGFDRIFLCAGCLHTNEILLRSIDGVETCTVTDNTIVNVPVLFTGKLPKSGATQRHYFALTNGQIIVRFDDNKDPIFIQLYPTPDYFWDYYLDPQIADQLRRWGFGHFLRHRLFWARIYLHSNLSQHYTQKLDTEGHCQFSLKKQPDKELFNTSIWPIIRPILSRNSFWVPPALRTYARTSSHYAGGFPLGSELVDVDGHLNSGVYVCDSANFPDCPSLSHTLTAMANARRIALAATEGIPDEI